MRPLSRRDLLLAAAAAAPSRRVRVGMIGFDGHTDEILRPLPELPGVELVAVANANSDPQAAAGVLKKGPVAKAKKYDGYAEMLDKEKLDCVAVCNNDGERGAAVLACANRRLPVIAEKPLATSREEFTRVKDAIEKSRVPAGMLLPMRYDPQFLAMKQIVDSGEIGEVLQIDAQKSYQLGRRPEWQKDARLYGSTILWIGIHMFDLMTFASGRRFTEVASYQEKVGFPEYRDMQIVTTSILKLDNGGTATLRMDYLRPASQNGHGDDRLRVAGTKGIVEYREDSGVVVMSAKGKRTLTQLPKQGSVFADFVHAAFDGAKPTLTWDEIVRVNLVTIAAHEAAEKHQFVRI